MTDYKGLCERLRVFADVDELDNEAAAAIRSLVAERDALRAQVERLEAENARQRTLIDMAWSATLDFCTTYNGRPSQFRAAELVSAKSIVDCNEALDAYLFPEAALTPPTKEQTK